MRRDRTANPLPPTKGHTEELEPHDAWQALAIVLAAQGHLRLPEELFTKPQGGAVVVFRDINGKAVILRYVQEDEDFDYREAIDNGAVVWTPPVAAFRPPSTRQALTGPTPGRRQGPRELKIGKGP